MEMVIKDIPDGITEEQIKEWISVFIERHYETKISKIPEFVSAKETAKINVDKYRVANLLKAKFAVSEVVEPVVVK